MIRKSIKKIDIIKNLSFQTGFSHNFSKKIVNDLVEIIVLNISLGNLILKNIGSFKLKKKKKGKEEIQRQKKNLLFLQENRLFLLLPKKFLKM